MIRKSLIPVLAVVLTLVAGLVLKAQSRPAGPAIGGYCPVAYVAMKRAVRGNPQISSVHEGKTYLFSNAEAKMMFDKDPAAIVTKANAEWPRVAKMP